MDIMSDQEKIKHLTNAVLIAIKRLEEIRYQKASDKVLDFLKETLEQVKTLSKG